MGVPNSRTSVSKSASIEAINAVMDIAGVEDNDDEEEPEGL